MRTKTILKNVKLMSLCMLFAFASSCSEDDDPNTEPVASFSAPDCVEVNAVAIFTHSSTDSEENIISYLWDFGDNSGTSIEENPSYTYTTTGSFTVSLTATDEGGLSNSTTTTVTVVEHCTNTEPVADFTASVNFAGVGENFSFTNASTDPESNITTYEWAFGDGETSTEKDIAHSYTVPGAYTVSLTVTDDGGLTANKELEVIVWGQKWANNIGTKIGPDAPAIGTDGTVYVGSLDSKLYAYNPDGTSKWVFTAGDAIRSAPSIGSDGTIYVGSLDDKLYAINADGTEKWSFTTGANIFYSNPAVSSDDAIVYIGSDDFNLYAINTADGTQKWAFTAGAQVRSSPTIATDGTIYVGTNEGKLHAINPTDGSEKWSFTAEAKIEASAAIGSDGTIYFGSGDAKFYALNSDGTQKWAFTTEDTNAITGSAVLDTDGNIYFGTKKGATTGSILYSLSSSGSENWKVNFALDAAIGSPEILSTPAIGADGTIYIPVSTGYLYGFNADDGSEKFKNQVASDDAGDLWDQAMWSSPALSEDGVLYYGDYAGMFYALIVSDQGLANSDWPMKSQNAKHTGLAK